MERLKTENGFWDSLSTTQYFAILLVVIIAFLILTGLTILLNTLWTIIFALPYSLAIPILYYIDARVQHKRLARYTLMFTFIFILNYLAINVGQYLTPFPFYLWAAVQHIIAFILVMTITSILCEKYLKPKLISPSKSAK